jgi:hypothetical protein
MTATRTASGLPFLEIAPERPSLDTVLRISLRGLPPGSDVTLRACQADPHGHPWQSSAAFTAAADGTVDLTRDAPVRGSYQHADPMGLVWSMTPADTDATESAGVLVPARLEVTAALGSAQVAAASCDGGTPQADARACAAAWRQTLHFLRASFPDGHPT